jgi:hypothetical protein
MDTQSHEHNRDETHPDVPDDDQEHVDIVRLCREGEVEFLIYLLNQAVPFKDELPKQFRDIARMPFTL